MRRSGGRGGSGGSISLGGKRTPAIMDLEIAILAENGAVRGADDDGGGGIAGVAQKAARVLDEELSGGVHFPVTGEAELGGIGAAEEEGRRVAAEIADTTAFRRW